MQFLITNYNKVKLEKIRKFILRGTVESHQSLPCHLLEVSSLIEYYVNLKILIS